MEEKDQERPELKWLDTTTQLLDNRFRIPGTEVRFGFDFLIGLIPGIGDVVSLGISGMLVTVMARKGASGMVIVKMLWNIFLDAIIGTVPIIGDLFDLSYRANRRNLELLKEHYEEGEHQGSATFVVIMVLLFVIGIFISAIYLIGWILGTFWALITGTT
ncbi:DUF4112 domain-containing protein [Lewinella cohaerens]|uniref:DUF4112 domain-containing protein n=1 Tax=Lewinella cohaerens TaxID=70995 RepID=UPI0003817DAF|nr:DUF4112 domain-containing protein [Lewinella cohaerens]